MPELTCLEICAGAGGQSLGLEQAGFAHAAAVEIDPDACQTLRINRPAWNVIAKDIRNFNGADYAHVDLLAGGVPCPPFSIAGKQLGADDERDLFPQALRLAEECEPTSVMLENVRGLSTGVDGTALAGAPPQPADPVDYLPRLTLEMAAVLQGFPPAWRFSGRKTASYRQIGNAFPPPVARAVGGSIRSAIEAARQASSAGPERLLSAV